MPRSKKSGTTFRPPPDFFCDLVGHSQQTWIASRQCEAVYLTASATFLRRDDLFRAACPGYFAELVRPEPFISDSVSGIAYMIHDLSDPPAPTPNCVNCAWREVCQKRFGQAPDYARHCVDYTYDVRLRTQKENDDSTDPENHS